MKKHSIAPPAFNIEAFNCPYCQVLAQQRWLNMLVQVPFGAEEYPDVKLCNCLNCRETSVWYKEKLIVPFSSIVEPPNPDLPEDLKLLYSEAASILQQSPRSAAALLRLLVEKLCIHLGEIKGDLNEKIKKLVSKGLPIGIQQALDIVRATGNSAVHGGEIVLDDSSEIAVSLFSIINMITEKMISEPKALQEMYDLLPESVRNRIDVRDGNKPSAN